MKLLVIALMFLQTDVNPPPAREGVVYRDPDQPRALRVDRNFLSTRIAWQRGETDAYGQRAQIWFRSVPDGIIHEEYAKARRRNTIGTWVSGIGGFLLAWQGIQAMFGEEANWTVVGVGGAMVVPGFFIGRSARGHLDQAVSRYNAYFAAYERTPAQNP